MTYGPVTTRAPFDGAAGRADDVPVRRTPVAPPEDRGRAAERSGSSTVPFEQIGQSAVKRLWRQNSETTSAPQTSPVRVLA